MHYCIVCDAPLEVSHSGLMSLAMCCVRESGETEATSFASLRLQMPKSPDGHFPVVLPLGGITQWCIACWATAMSSSILRSPLQRYMFSRSHQEAEMLPRKLLVGPECPAYKYKGPILFSWFGFQIYCVFVVSIVWLVFVFKYWNLV